jgi:hypothetical protein
MDIVTRAEWNARKPKGFYSPMPPTPIGVKIHYTGGREDFLLAVDHGLCIKRVRSVQTGHMDGNGWTDIGYSFVVCPHGTIFEARGLGNVPAANGPGLNSGHYAILMLVGNAGLTKPTEEMVRGVRQCIAYIRRNTRTGKEIAGHRDGYATDCPGTYAYQLVKSGALEPDNSREDDDMPSYLSLALDKDAPLDLTPDHWTTLAFDTEYADPDNQHAKGRFPSFLSGKAHFSLTLSVVLSGLLPGVEGQVRLYEVDEAGKRDKVYPIEEWRASEGLTYVHHSTNGTVDAGNKLRAEIVQFGGEPAGIASCSVKVLYWS